MSASLVGWLVSIIFVVLLVAGFLIGLWRGLKLSTVILIISIVGVVIAFFITPLITNAILNIKINVEGEPVALNAIILEYIMSIEDVGNLVEKNPNLETFFLNLPSAIINVVLFMFVTIAIEVLLYVVYKILAKTVFKINPEKKKHRLMGGLVGTVKTLIIVLIAFMPFASLIGVASTITTTGDYGVSPSAQVMTLSEEQTDETDNGLIAEVLPETALNVINGFENNLLTKMCGVFGMDNALFDYYGSFNVGGENLKIREEIVNVYNVVDLSNQLTKVDESYSFKDFNYEKISNTLNRLTSSPMFENVLADTLGEIIINYKDYAFIRDSKFAQDNAQILDAISLGLKAYTEAGGKVSDYFTDDINKLIDIALSMGQSGMIDEIFDLEEVDVEGVVQVLTSDQHYESTKTNLDVLFTMNLIRDGAEEIVKDFATKLSTDIDPIGVSTENWTDADWSDLSSSISSVAKRYSNISAKVDIWEVLSDATILLDKQKNYDISTILSELGSLIDEARDVNLLQTSENKPIIDKLLSKYDIPLPNEQGVIAQVKENNGTDKTLRTHKELLEFISPSLVKIRDKEIYSIIAGDGETNDKLKTLAIIVSEEGNEKLLSDIIMPLYQVEPTKSLIISKVSEGLNSDLIDLSVLSTYDDWKADLDYISVMLKTLNGKTMSVASGGQIEEKTYLELALNDQLSLIIDNLQESDIDPIIQPIFYAKSTDGIKNKVLTTISGYLGLFIGDASLTLSTTGVTFIEGNAEDQTQEFCNVLKKLLPLKTEYVLAGLKLKNVDKTQLGESLATMQINAYRKEINLKQEDGMFKESFIELMEKFKS